MLVTYLANAIIGVYTQHMCLSDIHGLSFSCFDDYLIQTPMVQCENSKFAVFLMNTAMSDNLKFYVSIVHWIGRDEPAF